MSTSSKSDNSFDLLRLVAALLVIYSHYYLSGRQETAYFQNFGYDNIGAVGVAIFFSISGYLVTQSWLADPSAPRFMARRILRIFPAFIIVTILSVFLIGALMTALPLGEYFHNADTWSYLENITLFTHQDALPGVFLKNPLTDVVNGPIWSLPYEFCCYIVVALAGTFGLYRIQHGNLALLLLFFCAAVIYGFNQGIGNIDITPVLKHMRHIEAFLVGSVLATGDYKSFPKLFLLPCLLALASLAMMMTKLVYVSPAIVAVVTVAIGKNLKLSIGKDDYSYGLYLWGYIVQQILAAKCPFLEMWPYIGLSVSLSFIPAMLSWHLIEKKALSFKPKRPVTA